MATFQLGETENKILCGIYEAALKPEHWQNVFVAIARHIGADEVIATLPVQLDFPRRLAALQQPENAHTYLAPPTPPVQNSTLTDISNLLRQSCSALIHVNQESQPGALIRTRMIELVMAFYQLLQSRPLTEDSLEFLHQLTPHFISAAFIYQEACLLKRHNYSLVESLKRTHQAIFLLDARRRIVFSTPEACKLLDSHAELRIGRSGQLEVADAKQQLALNELLQELMVTPDAQQLLPRQLAVACASHADRRHPLKISAIRLCDTSSQSDSAIHIAVFVENPGRTRIVPQEYLRQAFAFTRTETQIAQLLLNGLSLAQISASRHTSLETVRWQIKSLLQKTNTKSQAEIIRLLMALSSDSCVIDPIADAGF
jgi:DNA-binding CsgD family transcriptional regulator